MCRISVSEKNQMIAFRKSGHSISETAKAFHHSTSYISKIAPCNKAERSAQCSAAQRIRRTRERAMRDVRMALIQPEIVKIEQQIAELQSRKADLLKSVG